MTLEESPPLSASSTMSELLMAYPGAQRALFAKYHIGGCKSCGFQPSETLAQVCERNDNLPVDEVITHIKESHSNDVRIQITPTDLASLMSENEKLKLLDARTREEHEAVKLPGSELLDQALIQNIFGSWAKDTPIVIYDHQGTRSMDAAAYFIGHGFSETKCLQGGIDAYSIEVDQTLPRYSLEFAD
jgi:rhodanese-related sulfurtransferase